MLFRITADRAGVDDEQDLSGMDLDQYKSLPGSEPENLKAGA